MLLGVCFIFLVLPVRGDLSYVSIFVVASSCSFGVVFDWSVVDFGLSLSWALLRIGFICTAALSTA